MLLGSETVLDDGHVAPGTLEGHHVVFVLFGDDNAFDEKDWRVRHDNLTTGEVFVCSDELHDLSCWLVIMYYRVGLLIKVHQV